MKLKQKQVAYMGHLFTERGLQVDPEKTRAIQCMPTPKDKKGVQRLLGMVNYLQKFSPSLSTVAAPLRQLLKDDVPFLFEDSIHGEALRKIKKLIAEAPVLKYFSTEDETSLQVDASQEGLGACLMQFGQPVAYASRSLTPAERHYAQIEKEMLAIVYGLNKFERYTLGRKVIVQSDHKPLEQIQNKSLAETPKRLQRMMLAVQKYDFRIEYRRGTEMYLADTLSRAQLPETNTEQLEQIYATAAVRCEEEDEIERLAIEDYLSISDKTATLLRTASEKDKEANTLASLINSGLAKRQTRCTDRSTQIF